MPATAARPAPGAWCPHALSVSAVGEDVDEDVWARVVALWRDDVVASSGRRGLPAISGETSALRAAVLRGDTRLLLVMDGPRLLGFATLGPEPGAGAVREVHVRPGVPDDEVLSLLVDAASRAASHGAEDEDVARTRTEVA